MQISTGTLFKMEIEASRVLRIVSSLKKKVGLDSVSRNYVDDSRHCWVTQTRHLKIGQSNKVLCCICTVSGASFLWVFKYDKEFHYLGNSNLRTTSWKKMKSHLLLWILNLINYLVCRNFFRTMSNDYLLRKFTFLREGDSKYAKGKF